MSEESGTCPNNPDSRRRIIVIDISTQHLAKVNKSNLSVRPSDNKHSCAYETF